MSTTRKHEPIRGPLPYVTEDVEGIWLLDIELINEYLRQHGYDPDAAIAAHDQRITRLVLRALTMPPDDEPSEEDV